MNFVSFHVDGADGVRGAEVLASAAADAFLFVDDGNEQHLLARNLVVVGIAPTPSVLMNTGLQRYHLYGTGRALAGAESAGLLVLDGDAEVVGPDGMSYLYGGAFFLRDGLYGRGGTNFGAACTLGPAVAALEAYFGLHEAVEAAAGTQHVVGTGVDAELTGRAMRSEVTDGEGARRRDELVALRLFLLDDVGQSAVGRLGFHLALCLGEGCSG